MTEQIFGHDLDADWGRFTEADFDEACSRLRRLARWYVLRYAAAGPPAWDEPPDGEWTLREIAEHVCGVRYYAEQVGSLTDQGQAMGTRQPGGGAIAGLKTIA